MKRVHNPILQILVALNFYKVMIRFIKYFFSPYCYIGLYCVFGWYGDQSMFLTCVLSSAPPTPLHPSAGLRLSDHAAVGLRKVPGGRGSGGCPAGDAVGGGGSGSLLSARHHVQRCHHSGAAPRNTVLHKRCNAFIKDLIHEQRPLTLQRRFCWLNNQYLWVIRFTRSQKKNHDQ